MKYIVLYNFGLGNINNTILSFIFGWGNKGTTASNAYIASQTDLSLSSVKKSLKKLKENGLIQVNTSESSHRHIVALTKPVEALMKPGVAPTEPGGGSERASGRLPESHNNIDNNIDDSIDENIDENIEDIIDEEEALECVNEYLSSRGV